jgi:hypothetical protein
MPRRLLILRRESLRRLHLGISLQQLRLVRLLRRMLLKAKQLAVVGRLPRPRMRLPSAGVLVPIIPIAPRPHVGAFLGVEAAFQIIDLRLELGELGLEGCVFNDPRIESRRELLARELGALQ